MYVCMRERERERVKEQVKSIKGVRCVHSTAERKRQGEFIPEYDQGTSHECVWPLEYVFLE